MPRLNDIVKALDEGSTNSIISSIEYFYRIMIYSPSIINRYRDEDDFRADNLLDILVNKIALISDEEFDSLLNYIINSKPDLFLPGLRIITSAISKDTERMGLLLLKLKIYINKINTLITDPECDLKLLDAAIETLADCICHLNDCGIPLSELLDPMLFGFMNLDFLKLTYKPSVLNEFLKIMDEQFEINPYSHSLLSFSSDSQYIPFNVKLIKFLYNLLLLFLKYGKDLALHFLHKYHLNNLHKFYASDLLNQIMLDLSGRLDEVSTVVICGHDDYNDGINLERDSHISRSLFGSSPAFFELDLNFTKKELVLFLKSVGSPKLIILDSHGNFLRLYANDDLLLYGSDLFKILNQSYGKSLPDIDIVFSVCEAGSSDESSIINVIKNSCKRVHGKSARVYGREDDGGIQDIKKNRSGMLTPIY